MIKEPQPNTVVYNKNLKCDVFILSGQYLSNGRVSNFWYWRRVKPDGTLSRKTSCGYGCFEESENNYKVEIKITKV